MATWKGLAGTWQIPLDDAHRFHRLKPPTYDLMVVSALEPRIVDCTWLATCCNPGDIQVENSFHISDSNTSAMKN